MNWDSFITGVGVTLIAETVAFAVYCVRTWRV